MRDLDEVVKYCYSRIGELEGTIKNGNLTIEGKARAIVAIIELRDVINMTGRG